MTENQGPISWGIAVYADLEAGQAKDVSVLSLGEGYKDRGSIGPNLSAWPLGF